MRLLWAAAPWLVVGTALPTIACPVIEPPLQQGALEVTWQPDPAPITVGKHFALDMQICPAHAVLTRADANMPEHQHGMNYRPSFKRVGDAKDGRWRTEGWLLHMPGRWDLRLDVQLGGRVEKIIETVMLP